MSYDNGGWDEQDALWDSLNRKSELIEELKDEVEVYKNKYDALFDLLKANKFEQQNEKLRNELGLLSERLRKQEEEYRNNLKVDDFERHLLDYIYTKAEIVNANRDFRGFHSFIIPGTFYYNCVFDDEIKNYFVQKGVKLEGDK